MYIETEKQIRILEALAIYKYLTISQMVRLGLVGDAKHKSYLNTVLKGMRERKRATIGCIKFSGTYKFQQREYVYYLTKYGEQDLILNAGLDISEIRRPKNINSMYERDYMHRKYFIDTQIALYQWSEKQHIDVNFFDTYFDYVGNSHKGTLRAITSVGIHHKPEKRIVPDGIFLLEQGSTRKLYVLEIHMGNDTGRAKRQILNHKIALDTGAVTEYYDLDIANRVLYVFENRNIMESTMRAVINSKLLTEVYYPYFLFTHFDDMIDTFTYWLDCRGERKNLF